MDIYTILTSVCSLLGTMSLWEIVKYWLNRKTNKRKEEAEADSAEFGVLKEMVNFLQEQLKEKEVRFSEQTTRLRKTQDENFRLLREKAMLELRLANGGQDVKVDEDTHMED